MVPRCDDTYPSGSTFEGYVSGEHRSCTGRGAHDLKDRGFRRAGRNGIAEASRRVFHTFNGVICRHGYPYVLAPEFG